MNSASPAGRRYMARFIPAMIGYVAAISAAVYLIDRGMVSGWSLYAAAIAPGLFILGVIWAMGMYLVEETDEYIRMRLIRAMMVATGVTLAIASVWGFLEAFADVEHVPAYYGFVIWCASMGLAQLWFKVTDR